MFMLVLMLAPKIETVKIQPVLENGFLPVLKAALPFLSLQEYVILMMIYPFVKVSKKTASAFYVGTLIAGVMLVIMALLCILVSQVFQFKSYNFLTVPLGMLTISTVLPAYPDIVYAMSFIRRIWPAYALTFMFVLPLITWIAASVRKSLKEEEG